MLLPKRKVNKKVMHENLLKYEQEQNKENHTVLDDKEYEFIDWYLENKNKEDFNDHWLYRIIYFWKLLFPERKLNKKVMHETILNHEQEQNKEIPIVLDDKVDEFINWYFENMVKGHYPDIGEYQIPKKMKNFIEKMAVWYELRYPDYEINRIMPSSSQEQIDINEVMFANNQYTNDILDEDLDIKDLDWNEFYNAKAFINSLPWSERYVFSRPKYQDIVYWNYGHSSAHLHLTRNGFVKTAEYMDYVISGISNEDLESKNIKEVVSLLKEKGVKFPANNEFEKAIKDYDNWLYQKEEMLNCVMYRIIERGGNRIGPRRALMFAKEFERNIDIPMKYGVNSSDPGLRLFINEYIKAGGSTELICYINYFSRATKYEKLEKVTVQEMIKTWWNNAATKYTHEETELHQRLVNVLTSQIDQEADQQLRLQKKIAQSN